MERRTCASAIQSLSSFYHAVHEPFHLLELLVIGVQQEGMEISISGVAQDSEKRWDELRSGERKERRGRNERSSNALLQQVRLQRGCQKNNIETRGKEEPTFVSATSWGRF